ncbi:Retrovirus-related Pol polyprotein from transposon 17.6, partial [Stegodyphus mimosarum]
MGNEAYEEELVKSLLENITSVRLEKEDEERQERIRKEDEERQERIRREEREFEITKMKLEAAKVKDLIDGKEESMPRRNHFELQKMIQKFDPEENDVSLYLVMFERQAKRANLNQSEWVSVLLTLLPTEIVQLIMREPEEQAYDYAYIKGILLKRFKLSPEKFRIKFSQTQKNAQTTWRDFAFELRNYFEEWISGLEINDFELLKDLMITDQMKRRVNFEVRQHFIDEWSKITSPNKLAELLEDYENVREYRKKVSPVHGSESQKRNKNQPNFRDSPRYKQAGEKVSKKTETFRNQDERHFEVRKPLKCYTCGSIDHLRPQCPKAQKDFKSTAVVNRVQENEEDYLAPYTTMAKVNGFDLPVLRDSGASIDVICKKYITPSMLTGETVWVKQPFDESPICLPLAHVEIEAEFGRILTKAAVIRNELDQGRYILGNRTAAKLGKNQNKEYFFQVNAVETRAQKRRQMINSEEKGLQAAKERGEHTNIVPLPSFPSLANDYTSQGTEQEEQEDRKSLLPVSEFNDLPPLLSISKTRFLQLQQQSEDLKPLFDIATRDSQNNSSTNIYKIEKGLLYKCQEDRLGNVRKLLVIPETCREKILSLCHEQVSGHLGVTKSKDNLARYFFWPKCYQDMETYIRTCDPCQRVGKSNDRKKAPLKLVPVISEVFSKINIDTCGPLPTTSKGNKYILTAICVASKYPEALPIEDITSVTIVDALLNLFSRMGFPKEIQCDQGTSFMSNLTTEFFERFGIKVSHSSVHHPQSNPVERFHRTIKRILRVLCLEADSDWEQVLPAALLALRTVTHESTGFTPAELVHGKNLRTPETLLYEHWTDSPEEEQPVTEYVFRLINRLKKCQELAVEKMQDQQLRRKKWYDKNAIKREFKEGDLVLILATSKANKLSVQWTGPGKVENKVSETNYIVSLPGKKERSQIYHINMLKPYYKRPEVINYLSCSEEGSDQIETEIDFPNIDTNPNVYDYSEVIKSSNLEELLEPTQRDQLQRLLNKYSQSFSNEPGMTDLVEHDIEVISNKPVRSKPYRMSHRQNEILKREIQRMLDLKIIEVGESDYTSPMILVEAPNKDPRPCVDYRRLNEITRTQFYPLPNIEERVEEVASAKYITVIDLAKGYWQIPLSPNAQRYAAFVTSFGTYRPLRLSFGLKNAPYFFSKMMQEVLNGCEEFAVPYLDDVAIFSKTWECHLKHLEIVLKRISRAKLTIKPSKCRFAQKHVLYLGHVVGQGYRKPSEIKTKAIRDFPTPKTKTDIRAFLGLAGYYSRYIPMYSAIAAPLTDLLKGKSVKGDILWNAESERAFTELKEKLTSYPVLYAPDFTLPFILQTDASDYGMGVVLTQLTSNGEEHPIIFLSKKFSEVEKKYCTTEKECASIVFGIKKLHYYLDGQDFIVQTDHNPLTWLRTNARIEKSDSKDLQASSTPPKPLTWYTLKVRVY